MGGQRGSGAYLIEFRTDRERQLYRRLLVMAHSDHALVERLIRYEATQMPINQRAELIDAAIERWVSDHNRWQ